jgi:hypothetical protein
MNLKNSNFLASIKTLGPRDFVYPGIVLIFLVILTVLFFMATRFISNNLNKIFSADQSTETQALDNARYLLTLKKLGISATDSVAVAVPSTTTPAVILDKKSLSLVVLNSTSKSGVANTLAKALVLAGFSNPKTGNEKTSYATTTIFIKQSNSAYTPFLLDEVKKLYPNTVATTTPETGTTDAIIIIGTH